MHQCFSQCIQTRSEHYFNSSRWVSWNSWSSQLSVNIMQTRAKTMTHLLGRVFSCRLKTRLNSRMEHVGPTEVTSLARFFRDNNAAPWHKGIKLSLASARWTILVVSWTNSLLGFLAIWWDLLTSRGKIEYLHPHLLNVVIQNRLVNSHHTSAIKSFCFVGCTYCSPFPGWSTWTPRSISQAANTKRGDAVNTNLLFWPERGKSAMWWPLLAAKGYSFN